QSTGLLDLDDLGMPPQILRRVRHVAHQPHGMVLVTGPTGSGKTTTLYAMLSELNRIEDKIITVEDPVEYRLPRINQVQIHPKIGLSFANVLRSVLRQDPDIVMVGEMRDQETVEIGIRAAMTGHLVLSTLHTNDAVSTAVRLTDMGVPGFMVAASLRAVLAQRLVRRVCESCARPQEPDAQQRAWVRAVLGHGAPHARFVHGAGCPHCNSTGYRGRIGVYELLELDDDMAEALRREDSAAFARGARAQPGYRPLVRVALDYAAEGVTSLDEVIRLAGEPDESVTAGTPEEEARTATAQTAPSERS
ncbi:MAG: type II/IV secretion system protein, partial [Gammaproteobacteria bacterium]|nr:type II/IV secretion system protein [Gammaproteobacteria bacterium]